MKRTFYEVLWAVCETEGRIDQWIEGGILLTNGTKYSWHPSVLDLCDASEIIGELVIPNTSTPQSEKKEEFIRKTPQQIIREKQSNQFNQSNQAKSEDINWIEEFIQKFSAKNIGIPGKANGKTSVIKKMAKFLADNDYTKEEILGATDLYINTLKKQGSIKYIRDCIYFINKRIEGVDISDLAKWCEEYRNNGGSKNDYDSRTVL
jgi:hypothetical protein